MGSERIGSDQSDRFGSIRIRSDRINRQNRIFSASKSLHSLHKIHVESRNLERKLNTSEKRLSAPIYPDLDIDHEETKSIEEENNLLGGDMDRLNGKIPTVR